MRWLYRSLTVIALAVASAAVVSATAPAGQYRLSEDRNRDGRPDVWRDYDRRGNLVQSSTDTNFDGRSDVRDIYDRGVLVRRETDRDFNNQVDLVVEFDRTTREEVRSIVDVDFDGRADVLTLIQSGKTVFTETAPPSDRRRTSRQSRSLAGADGGAMAPMEDPFQAETSVRALPGTERCDCSAWSDDGGALAAGTSSVVFAPPAIAPARAAASRRAAVFVDRVAPRGPPAPHSAS